MLPIVQFPRIVEQHAPWFDSLFGSDEQRQHFREYVTGLIVGDAATVTTINNLFLDHNDQSALNKFLTQADWDEQELNRRRIRWELARLQRRPISAAAGRLIIDDRKQHCYIRSPITHRAGNYTVIWDGWAGPSLGPQPRTLRVGT